MQFEKPEPILTSTLTYLTRQHSVWTNGKALGNSFNIQAIAK
uniref:Uncharacterized protein n=1 Tax=Anopheles minimus TaxID=112268 RepID=A0A182WPC0_9DIPT